MKKKNRNPQIVVIISIDDEIMVCFYKMSKAMALRRVYYFEEFKMV